MYYKIHGPLRLSLISGMSFTMGGENAHLICVYFGVLFPSCNKKSPDLTVLLFHCFSTQLLPKVRHISYSGTFIKSVSCAISRYIGHVSAL